MQTGVAAALEALAVAALVSPDDLHVAVLHKEGAHGLVALPLAEYQVDVGFNTRIARLLRARPFLCTSGRSFASQDHSTQYGRLSAQSTVRQCFPWEAKRYAPWMEIFTIPRPALLLPPARARSP